MDGVDGGESGGWMKGGGREKRERGDDFVISDAAQPLLFASINC